jgi:hypothetical protein
MLYPFPKKVGIDEVGGAERSTKDIDPVIVGPEAHAVSVVGV